MEVYCSRRGQYSLGALTATATDHFALFPMHRNFGEPQNIIVYPATLDLPFFRSISRDEPGQGPGRWSISESGPSAAHVREYTNGDTLNRIHWHSTAHTGKLMVKEFDADRSSHANKNIWIVLDMYQASQVGVGDDGTEEYGISVAASLIKQYMDCNKEVGLIACGERPYLFPPQAEEEHHWKMLEALALMKATGEVPIGQLISQEIELFGSNSLIIVITSSVNERIAAPLRQVRNRGNPVIVVLLDSASFGGPSSTANATGMLVSNGFQVYVTGHREKPAMTLIS
jgi:uncharacterized protein (DUF58 family)